MDIHRPRWISNGLHNTGANARAAVRWHLHLRLWALALLRADESLHFWHKFSTIPPHSLPLRHTPTPLRHDPRRSLRQPHDTTATNSRRDATKSPRESQATVARSRRTSLQPLPYTLAPSHPGLTGRSSISLVAAHPTLRRLAPSRRSPYHQIASSATSCPISQSSPGLCARRP